jgi:lysophospholipase L1-like esterase
MTRTLLCYGDSNTHGTGPVEALGQGWRFSPDQRWTRRMARDLAPDWEVIEEGLPGRTTLHDDPIEGAHRNGLAVLPAILESHSPVDLVILMLGTNDLKPRFSVHAPDIALSLERLITAIRASACGPDNSAPQVLLVAPPPVIEVGCLAEIFEGAAPRSQRLGPSIRAAALRSGVPFFDAADHIAVSPVDGIHYDATAHAALALALAAAVRQHFG